MMDIYCDSIDSGELFENILEIIPKKRRKYSDLVCKSEFDYDISSVCYNLAADTIDEQYCRSSNNTPIACDIFDDMLDNILINETAIPIKSEQYNSHQDDREKVMYPKGYVSDFNFFILHKRPQLLAANKSLSLSNNTINKLLGEMWKELSPMEKDEYVQMANTDKIRYLKEVAKYNLISPEKIIPRINPPPGCNIDGTPVTKQSNRNILNKTTTTANPNIKRPLTAYSIFAQQEKQFVAGLECKELQKKMGKYFGLRWKQMCDEEKALYTNLECAYKTSATVVY